MSQLNVFEVVYLLLLLTGNCNCLCKTSFEGPSEQLNIKTSENREAAYQESLKTLSRYDDKYCYYCSLCPNFYFIEGGLVYEMHPKYFDPLFHYYRSIFYPDTCRMECFSLPAYLVADESQYELVSPTHSNYYEFFLAYGDPKNKGESLFVYDPQGERKFLSPGEVQLGQTNPIPSKTTDVPSIENEGGYDGDEDEETNKEDDDNEDIVLALICVFGFIMICLGAKFILSTTKNTSVTK